jgi:hypothetical protein
MIRTVVTAPRESKGHRRSAKGVELVTPGVEDSRSLYLNCAALKTG